MRGAAGTVAVAIVSALALALGLSTSAWAANAFSTHSYGADFASINWGDACDSANNENELVTDFGNDWLTVTFHGAMNRAPWHVSSIDLSNTSSHRISFVQSRWGFRVNDVYAPVYVTVPDLYPGRRSPSRSTTRTRSRRSSPSPRCSTTWSTRATRSASSWTTDDPRR